MIRFSDNLIDQKAYTTSRNQFGINVNGLLTKFWNANFMINILNMGNDSNNDTTKVDFSSLVLGMNHVFIIGQQSFLQNISVNYVYQKSENNSALLSGSVTKVNTVNLGFSYYISENLSANTSFGLVSSIYADTVKSDTKIVSLGINHNALSNKLHTSFSISTSFLQSNSSYRTILSSGYSFTASDKISLTVSYNAFRTTEINGSNFNEVIAGLNYSHNF